MSFETQIRELDSDQLDALFDAIPDTTPTADNLAVGKEVEEVQPVVQEVVDGIPVLPDEQVNELPDEKEEEKVEDTKTEEIVEDKKSDENKTQVNEVLKNTVTYLIDNGFWADFEGREDLEFTDEVYADLASKQAQHSAYEIVNELIDSTGSYGKAIIDHIKRGGNPDEIIDLFKEQKALQQIDTSNENGKQQKIESYYKDVLGWKSDRIQRHINRLLEDNDIETEFSEVEDLYNKYYEERLAEKQEEGKRIEEENKQRQKQFVNNIKSALEDDTSLNAKDRKLISESILDFRHKLDNGQKVNDFYIKFAEMQADPKKYIKLVQFVMDPENYNKRIQTSEKTKVSKEVFNFIKGNKAVSTAKTNNIEIQPSSSERRGTDFSFAIKK